MGSTGRFLPLPSGPMPRSLLSRSRSAFASARSFLTRSARRRSSALCARSSSVFTGLYTAWNCAQFARNRRDVLQVHPEYEQCWFNHQSEWSSYGYNCAATIDHLPHEFKLLWHSAVHNSSALSGPGRADCNLPSLCHACRGGRDGDKRPPADLMANVPCGWCRCANDLHEPSLVTLPEERRGE